MSNPVGLVGVSLIHQDTIADTDKVARVNGVFIDSNFIVNNMTIKLFGGNYER
jgi:hypothetical protein